MRLRNLVTTCADGLLIVNRHGVVRSANPAAGALLDRSPDQLVLQPFDTPIVPGRCVDIEAGCPGRPTRVAELHSTAIDWDGEPSYLVTLRDVTEQRRQRAEHLDALDRERRTRHAAELAERRAAFLADASAMLAGSLDYESALAGLARLAVPFFADWCAVHLRDGDRVRLVGLAGSNLAPIPAGAVGTVSPINLTTPRGVAAVLRSGRTEHLPEITDDTLADLAATPGELQVLRGMGLRSSLIAPMTVRDQTLGTLAFAVVRPDRAFTPADRAVAEDLGRRAAVAVDTGRACQQLPEADRRKDEFLAMLAHELRNPLAPLRNALYMLRQGDGDRAAKDWAWDVVNRQVGHMGRLVDGLLDVSRVTRGRVTLQREPVDLAALIRCVAGAARPLIDARRHTLNLRLALEPLTVEGDPLRLEQVLANLLDNAARYTPPGGRVDVIIRADRGDAVVEVTDTGVGIPPDMLATVFDLFTQAERPLDRSEGWLGIGLTLVKRLVELHGGQVMAHREGPGTGSSFTVRLPALAPATDEVPGQEVHRRRVLVVDDNRDLAESLAIVLRLWGHDVTVAYDGPAALTAARARPPEVVLLDIGLPYLDGFEVARRMRQEPKLRDARIVAITGYGREEDRQRSRDVGIDLHLTKPVDPMDLQPLLADTE